MFWLSIYNRGNGCWQGSTLGDLSHLLRSATDSVGDSSVYYLSMNHHCSSNSVQNSVQHSWQCFGYMLGKKAIFYSSCSVLLSHESFLLFKFTLTLFFSSESCCYVNLLEETHSSRPCLQQFKDLQCNIFFLFILVLVVSEQIESF